VKTPRHPHGQAFPAWLISVILASSYPVPSRASDESYSFPPALTDPGVWDQPGFIAAWQSDSTANIAHKIWPSTPTVFGRQPHYISGHFVNQRLESITLLFLDSGTHFGYVPKDQAAATEKMNREVFQALHRDTAADVLSGLEKLAGVQGHPATLGNTPMLRQEVLLFDTGKSIARYLSIPEQLVKVTFYRDKERAGSLLLEPASAGKKPRERMENLVKNLREAGNGDHLLENIPLFPQGDRAYCGVSALSMGMQYLGLNLDTEDFAAAAGIRYGSTKGSKIREVYEAAGQEAGMRLSRATKFDFRRAQAVLDAGLPLIVWRRWAKERDYVHTTFASRYADDPSSVLPKADMNDRATWPDKDAYSHASVITGYNAKRGEVIFTESWGEAARNRRMRFEEMEGTAYYTFYPKP
jgi:hypothetical protein